MLPLNRLMAALLNALFWGIWEDFSSVKVSGLKSLKNKLKKLKKVLTFVFS